MTQHLVEYSYREMSSFVTDLDPSMDQEEKEAMAIVQIKEDFPDIALVEILEVSEIN